jgi:hypothetical protein
MKKTIKYYSLPAVFAIAMLAGSCRYAHNNDVNETPGGSAAPVTAEGENGGEARDSSSLGGRTPAQSLSNGQAGSEAPNSSGKK